MCYSCNYWLCKVGTIGGIMGQLVSLPIPDHVKRIHVSFNDRDRECYAKVIVTCQGITEAFNVYSSEQLRNRILQCISVFKLLASIDK